MSDNYYNNQDSSQRDPFASIDNMQNANREVFNTGMFDDYSNSQYSNYNYATPTGYEGIKTIATERVVTKSFLFMFVALVITAFASLTTSALVAQNILSGGSAFLFVLAELAIVFASSAALRKNNVVLGGILYTIYSFLTGMTFSLLFVLYNWGSVVSIFFLTAVMFGGMAVFGLATKKDLTKIGSICMMGLWGIILASVVNMVFLRSSGLGLIENVIGILIFTGLTAWDVQKIKNMCAYSSIENENALAMMGAFELYLDFINLFLRLLRLFGKRR